MKPKETLEKYQKKKTLEADKEFRKAGFEVFANVTFKRILSKKKYSFTLILLFLILKEVLKKKIKELIILNCTQKIFV